nr:hypothetical protein [Deltaproteobacteria bacterium]
MLDLRMFLDKLETTGELKIISGAKLKYEVGVISELAFQRQGPALLFDKFEGYAPNYRVASNVCSTRRRSLLGIGMDPELSEGEAMTQFKKRWDAYKPI